MKSKILIVFVFLSLVFNNKLLSQDKIILISGDTILATVIQMDEFGVYFYNLKSNTDNIEMLSNLKISLIELENNNYGLENIKFEVLENKKDTILSIPKNGTIGIGLNLFPIADVSVNFDLTNNINLEFGTGILYNYIGGKVYLSNSNKKWRNYIGLYIYKFKISDTGNKIDIPFGFEYRNSKSFFFKIDLGIWISNDSFYPMPRLGFGLRFK